MSSYNGGNNYDCSIEFDGASKGNPGRSGAGAILRGFSDNTTWQLREGLGDKTCNVAEYKGLILGLRTALQKGYRRVNVFGDSNLVCNQVLGNWLTKSSSLKILNHEVQYLRNGFDLFSINHVAREQNCDADREANEACLLPSAEECGFDMDRIYKPAKVQDLEDDDKMISEEEARHVQCPQNGALVIRLGVAQSYLSRMLVSSGSSCNVLYKAAFDQLKPFLFIKSPTQMSVRSMFGNSTYSKGTVTLPVTMGEAPCRVTKMIDFQIVDAPSNYDAIIGFPTLCSFSVVVSIRHLMMIFPTPEGRGIVRGDQAVAQACSPQLMAVFLGPRKPSDA